MPAASEIPSPCEVLTQLLAYGIEDKPAFFLGLEGNVAFEVDGDRSFVLRLGCPERPLEWGIDDTVGLRLSTDRAVIERLLHGQWDAQADLASGALRLEGELDLLQPLVQILTQGQSALELRTGQ